MPARWIRLHYAYPRDFPDQLIDAVAAQPNLARYLDMPLQHIADPVLRRMKRGRDSAWVRKLVRKLRDRVPDLTFRTSFIVGFPGETEAEFQELCDFVEEMRFERVGVFQFSREEGTASYDLDGQLPARTKAARQKKLLGIQRKISKMHQQALVGRTLPVLIEGVSEETDLLLEGRWMGQAPEIDGKVYVNRGQAAPGQVVPVLVEQAGDHDLVGGIVGADGPGEQRARCARRPRAGGARFGRTRLGARKRRDRQSLFVGRLGAGRLAGHIDAGRAAARGCLYAERRCGDGRERRRAGTHQHAAPRERRHLIWRRRIVRVRLFDASHPCGTPGAGSPVGRAPNATCRQVALAGAIRIDARAPGLAPPG